MSRQQGRYKQSAQRPKPMDLNMLNEHGKKINAEAERLQRDRENLMQERTQASTQTFGRGKGAERSSRLNPPSGQYEGAERYGRRGVPETIPEEPERRYRKASPGERVGNLKGLIDRLVDDAKIESQEVKERLRGIQQKQQQLLNDIEDYGPKFGEERPTGLFEPSRPGRYTGPAEDEFEVWKRPYSDYQAIYRGTGEGRRQRPPRGYREEGPQYTADHLGEDDVGGAYAGPDQAGGLGALQGKIADEILGLREKNIKLLKSLNAETQNFNDLLADFKRLEEDNLRLKEHLANIADEVNSVTVDGVRLFNVQRISLDAPQRGRTEHAVSYNGQGYGEDSEQIRALNRELDKVHRENQGLKEKLRKASTYLSRQSTSDNYQDLKDENARLKQTLRAARADADRLEQQLSQRERGGFQNVQIDDEKLNRLNQTISDLKDQLGQANQDVSRLRAENRRLEDRLGRGVGGEVQAQLEELKQENDRLRKETIDLLKANTGGTTRNLNGKYKVAHREYESPKYGSYPSLF